MSLLDLLNEYRVDYANETHPSVSQGWVGIHCPFCVGSKDYHLGANLESWGFHCWRCGPHKTTDALAAILHISGSEAFQLLKKHKRSNYNYARLLKKKEKDTNKLVRMESIKFPSMTGKMTELHKNYLISRNFDPDKLEKEWGLLGTGPIAYLGKINYKFRVLAPFYWNGKIVTFQARDCTGQQAYRYLACPPDEELISIKSIVYQHKDVPTGGSAICVEGITDVWRLGKRAFAVLGIEYSTAQLLSIAKMYKKVIILFDPEPQAQRKARSLSARLQGLGIETRIEKLTSSDPADLKQEDADALVRHVLTD
jgi:5S rRNA maturation endonuclease (ribonuclease M5)